ncbi:hypothetical protein ACRALDRAFT_1066457, partial [Sodiomyces alcalophilus JCM 7366]|uniref:uncharacterized protein n=1 Tax=Sodiomyces alcalophilus JCM 7366 TaxID=591952 RepID=UPI0039B39AB3
MPRVKVLEKIYNKGYKDKGKEYYYYTALTPYKTKRIANNNNKPVTPTSFSKKIKTLASAPKVNATSIVYDIIYITPLF